MYYMAKEILNYLTHEKYKSVIKLIKTYDLNVNAFKFYGDNLLYYMVYSGDVKLCEFLIKRGININFLNNLLENALHYAMKYGYDDICELLVKHDININALNGYKNTPLYIGVDNDNTTVNALNLLRHGANVHILVKNYFVFLPLYKDIIGNANVNIFNIILIKCL